jgi:equilibrative nucleoside transporter 1/2/3
MILASSPALNPKISDDEKDVAGTLAAFCLVAGLAGGSVCSFGVNWLVRGSVFG